MKGRSLRMGFLLKDLRLGGVEKITLKLIYGLINEGCGVFLYLFASRGELFDQIPVQTQVVILDENKCGESKWTWAVNEIGIQNLDALFISSGQIGIRLFMANRFSSFKPKLIAIQHVPINLPGASSVKNIFRALFARLYFRSVDYAVGVSEDIKNDLINYVASPSDATRIYNPVINEGITKLSTDQSIDLEEIGKYIVAVGRLDFQKNYELMLDAYQTFIEQTGVNGPFKLLIVGDGPLKSDLINSINQRGLSNQVRLLGFLSNPFPYIRSAEALIMTSRWEGLPTVIIEALTLGTQVISTDCPTGPRELLKNGEYGFLCPNYDIDSISDSIRRVFRGEKKDVPSEFLNQFLISESTKEYIKLVS